MDLVTPQLGLLFWTGLVFLILLFLLTKFAWKPILNAVNNREAKIAEALELAEKTKQEMEALKAQNQNLLKEARAERDKLIKDAKQTANEMIEKAKQQAAEEGNKIIASAKESIESEKRAAIVELKNQMAEFSIQIAEKIVKEELSLDDKQKALAEKLVEDINLN